MNRILRPISLALVLAVAGASQAQQPTVNIGERHGNLRAAQEHIVQAYQLIGVAQQDNDSRLGGHAGRARELLIQADQELRQAANVANNNGRP
ncbi:hypothetical protein [Stenotrophomonas sp.]|uniref:hypothetical protein n=1 Tax=Stenotrophomonas sp. TaxID=69392 RepID=UPI00289E8D48|nr:hypothetical protein [Stenotrophomonas sp.]